MTAAETVAAWLDRNATFAPEYGGALSTHLPMTVVALHALGASAERIDTWARGYAARLAPAPAPEAWPAGEPWRPRLGQPGAYAAYRSLFVAWIGAEGSAETVAQAVPWLMPGCGAAAFHGLIRTAYALRHRHGDELADALAYWACRHLPLGTGADDDGSGADTPDPVPLLRQLPFLPRSGGLIAEAMPAAAAHPAFEGIVRRLVIDEHTLPTLARIGAEVYAQSASFTVLHLVTGAHALHTVLPLLEDPADAVWHFWRAFAAAASTSGALPRLAMPEPMAWEALSGAALAQDDEHVIKLVHACRELETAFGGPVFGAAATRAVLDVT